MLKSEGGMNARREGNEALGIVRGDFKVLDQLTQDSAECCRDPMVGYSSRYLGILVA